MRELSNARDHPRGILKEAPFCQVVLAVRMTTSGAALTGVDALEAVPVRFYRHAGLCFGAYA
jgi:hypothetical protein